MFKNFYRTTFSFLKPLLLLLGLLLPFSLCIADGYVSISPTWDEYTQNHKTYYFENGLDHFNQGQYKQAFKNFRKAQEYGIGLGSVYLAKMYLEGKGVKVDYKKAQLYAKNAIKGYGSGMLGGALILGRMQAEGLGMKKDLKQVLKTYRRVVRILSNKGINFHNNFRLPNLAQTTGIAIGLQFIDLSGLSANPKKFGKKFEKLEDFKYFLHSNGEVPDALSWADIAEISSNITLLKQQMGESFIELGSLIKKGLAPENKKIGLKNFCKNPQNLAMKKQAL
ncbi:HP0519 family Sel1-like repeat protein [Helicobacter pylori]